ncbi:hypothetical protein ABCS02_20805 [Microbacterium sp. X-17]|uniref:hypothetical protein n=1 Tax=Microbacterium sp. X-17 TaxID=3144404 RepID=UPI0031F5911A
MSSSDRQRIEKVPGRRRARLTPAPGTTAEPAAPSEEDGDAASGSAEAGPNDERLCRDVPPHY